MLAIVLNTTDKYCDLWDTWYYHFKRWKHNYPVYFLNERLDVPYDVTQIKVDIPEVDLWTKKLRESLKQIPEDEVLVMLEDHWIAKPFEKGEFELIYGLFQRLDADAMRISPPSSLTSTELFQGDVRSLTPNSKYLISHDPNMWRKKTLLECLDVDESPWDNEIKGTNRIRDRKYSIYHYEKYWWVNAMVKGRLTPEGHKMLI